MEVYDYGKPRDCSWKEIWDKKGKLDSENLVELAGYEGYVGKKKPQDFLFGIAENIIDILKVENDDRVLEVGCGCGALSQFFDCEYHGVDYSSESIKKHKQLFPKHKVLTSEANSLPFEDNYFDRVFIHGVCHYFPDMKYFNECKKELFRVSKKNVLIADLPESSHDSTHLLFNRSTLENEGWKIYEGFYNPVRFCAYIEL